MLKVYSICICCIEHFQLVTANVQQDACIYNKNRERVTGKHGVGDLTNNGERVIGLCEENNHIIGGALFTHRNIRKLSWTSLDGRSQRQMDYIIISCKWRGSLQDVRVMRNADAGSDHNMVVAKMTMKL